MIPKTIHYCWFGDAGIDSKLAHCIESWRKLMPDYRIKEWNEANSPMGSAYVQTAYTNGLWSKISNFVRLYAVYKEGGLYFDVDVEVIARFDDLLTNECFFGFQQPQQHEDWVNNAVFGAVARHPFLARCMNETFARFMETGSYYRSPEVTTKVLTELGLHEYGPTKVGDIQLYPAEYFYPYPWWGKFHPECIKENTFCIHHWQLSWIDDDGQAHDVPLATPPPDRRATGRTPPLPGHRRGSLEIQITDVRVHNKDEYCESPIEAGVPVRINIRYDASRKLFSPVFSVVIEQEDGAACLEADNRDFPIAEVQGAATVSLIIDRLNLPSGRYYLNVAVYERDWAYAYDWQWRVLSLDIHAPDDDRTPTQPSFCWEIT